MSQYSYGAFTNTSVGFPVYIFSNQGGTWSPLLYDEGGSNYPPYFATGGGVSTTSPVIATFYVSQAWLNNNFSFSVPISGEGNSNLSVNDSYLLTIQDGAPYFAFVPHALGLPNSATWPPPAPYQNSYELARTLPVIAGTLYDVYTQDTNGNWNLVNYNTKNADQIAQSQSTAGTSSYAPIATPYPFPIIFVPQVDYTGSNCAGVVNRGYLLYTNEGSNLPSTGFTTVEQCENEALGAPSYSACGNGQFGACVTADLPICVSAPNSTTVCGTESTSSSTRWGLIILTSIFALVLIILLFLFLLRGTRSKSQLIVPEGYTLT